MHEHPKRIMDKLGSVYCLKDGSVEKPERYLGIDIKPWTIQGEDCIMTECYAMSCKTYIKEAIRVVEKRMVDFNCLTLQQEDMVKTHKFPRPLIDLNVKKHTCVAKMK